MSAVPPKHREWSTLLPILAGLFWLTAGEGAGWYLWATLPGLLLVASGVSALLWAGEPKQTQYMAFGGALGLLLFLPAAIGYGFGTALLAALLSLASFVMAGKLALDFAEEAPGAPRPGADLRTWAKAALDEALVGYFVLMARVPHGAAAERMCVQAVRLETVLQARCWLDDPASFHRTPSAPDDARLTPARGVGRDYERLRFTSGFVPDPELPGATEWLGHRPNRECSAHVFRHAERGRPWLLCIHGYRMGLPFLDLRLFPPHILHERYGLNLVMPTLPLHGPRRIGRQSGDHFLDGDLLDLLHAESQALWDLRRTIAWIRAQEPDARIGVLGYSLGGYNTALLAAHQSGLDFAVAGIPVCEFASTLWNHIPVPHRDYFTRQGLDEARYRRLLKVVAPTALPPKLANDRLHIFAGTADRVVPPVQPLHLAAHWGRPISWFGGAHLTFRGEQAVVRCIEDAMTGAGWLLRRIATE
ncbi:MAG: hypothetical protein NVS9B10_02910 [Nevskia sp.]